MRRPGRQLVLDPLGAQLDRRRVAAQPRPALPRFGAEAVEEGESAGEEFAAPLEAKEAVWADDLAMLRRTVPELPFVDDLAQELARLREIRATTTNPAGPAPPQN